VAGTLVLAAVAIVVPIGPAQAAVSHVWPVCRQGSEGGWTYTTFSGHDPRYAVDINRGAGRDDFQRIVVASAAGTLHAKDVFSGYGNTLTIKHSDGTYSFYAHLSWRTTLSVGAYIEKGRPIASIGESGSSATSPHLHYEQRNGPNYSDPGRTIMIGGSQLTYYTTRSFVPTVPCT